jgi:hypothetical protein
MHVLPNSPNYVLSARAPQLALVAHVSLIIWLLMLYSKILSLITFPVKSYLHLTWLNGSMLEVLFSTGIRQHAEVGGGSWKLIILVAELTN